VAGILKELRECGCPKNIYGLTKGYFIQRIASFSTNNLRTEKEISGGCAKGLCCGPGFWSLQYNWLLELKYVAPTKVVAFADDLIIATRGESVREVENYVNIEVSKINGWSRNNKTKFNDKKIKSNPGFKKERERKQEHNSLSKQQTIRPSYSDEILRNNSGPNV
jgi:hypothetical protein